jgi:hypothetical protein
MSLITTKDLKDSMEIEEEIISREEELLKMELDDGMIIEETKMDLDERG